MSDRFKAHAQSGFGGPTGHMDIQQRQQHVWDTAFAAAMAHPETKYAVSARRIANLAVKAWNRMRSDSPSARGS